MIIGRFLRLKPDRLAAVVDRAVVIPRLVIRDATTGVCEIVPGIETDGFAEIRNRAIALTLLPEHIAAIHVCRRQFGVEPDRRIEVGARAVQFAPAGEALAAFVIGHRDLGMEPDRLVQVGEGVGVIALSRPCLGPPEIDLGEPRTLEFAGGDQPSAGRDRGLRRAVLIEADGAIVGRGGCPGQTGDDKTGRDEREQAVHGPFP